MTTFLRALTILALTPFAAAYVLLAMVAAVAMRDALRDKLRGRSAVAVAYRILRTHRINVIKGDNP